MSIHHGMMPADAGVQNSTQKLSSRSAIRIKNLTGILLTPDLNLRAMMPQKSVRSRGNGDQPYASIIYVSWRISSTLDFKGIEMPIPQKAGSNWAR